MRRNTSERKRRGKWTDSILFSSILMIALLFAGQLLGMALEFFPAIYSGPIRFSGLHYLECIGVWIVTLLYLRFTKKNRPILKCLWRSPSGNTVKFLLLGAAIGFGMNGFCILVAWLHGDIKLYFDRFHLWGMCYLAVTVFIQSSSEELLCRVFLYQRILKRTGKPIAAILGNALIFALLHAVNPSMTIFALLNVVLAGVLFSLAVYYLDSVWCAMAMHAAWNYTQNILFGLPNFGHVLPFSMMKLEPDTAVNSFAYDVGFGIEGTILTNIVLLAACAAFVFWGRYRNVQPLDVWGEAASENAEYV